MAGRQSCWSRELEDECHANTQRLEACSCELHCPRSATVVLDLEFSCELTPTSYLCTIRVEIDKVLLPSQQNFTFWDAMLNSGWCRGSD